jgi:hypothetical protein
VRETTLVRVLDRHIKAGKPCTSGECPFALAVTGALAAEGVTAAEVTVDFYDVTVAQEDESGCRRYRASLPDAGRSFVNDVDDKRPVSPLEVELHWEMMA